jgi:hypothetical protein
MTLRGHVENGAIVVDDKASLPEGAVVFIEIQRLATPLHDPYGLLADNPTGITEEDIAEARREMWGNFPRDDF